MQLPSWLLMFLCLICTDAFVFSCRRDKAKEPIGTFGEHARVIKNLPEHARGCLDSKRMWLILALVLCLTLFVIYKRNPVVFLSCLFRLPLKRIHLASPSKDSILRDLYHFEMDLEALMSKVRNLQATMNTSGHCSMPALNNRATTQISITRYEIEDEDYY